jgi:chemotaxis protein MotB
MAYYMLVRGGIPDARIVRIEGHADHDLKVVGQPLAAENRRIEVLLLKGKS